MLQIRDARDDDEPGLIALIAGVFAEYPGCVMDVDGELPELRRHPALLCQLVLTFENIDSRQLQTQLRQLLVDNSGMQQVVPAGERSLILFFYVDHEEYDRPQPDVAYFHAQWRRENPTDGWGKKGEPHTNAERAEAWSRPNLHGDGNYVILEAKGRGHYVGCNLNIDVFEKQQNDWYGEGDDMIWIDGELVLRGTGTEDYFNTAFCPAKTFSAPYHGLTVYSGTDLWPWSGKNSMYRYHIEDPIHFRQSIKVTIEHGHANDLSNDYSSTAYWYQLEPHAQPSPLLPAVERLPRPTALRL